MKCPICNGKGYQFVADYDGMYDIVCEQCKGKGELDENGKPILTNEEYLKSCTTEHLADLMSRIVGCSNCPIPKDGRSCMGTYSGCWNEIIKWLKQPHTKE